MSGALQSHWRREDERRRNLAAARSVWPGPQSPLWPPADVFSFMWRCDPVFRREKMATALGIALGWEAVRARRERFAAWLRAKHAPVSLVKLTAEHMSPEAAVAALMRVDVRHLLCSLFACMGANVLRTPCPGCQPVGAETLLASPEWQALPWQSEGAR